MLTRQREVLHLSQSGDGKIDTWAADSNLCVCLTLHITARWLYRYGGFLQLPQQKLPMLHYSFCIMQISWSTGSQT